MNVHKATRWHEAYLAAWDSTDPALVGVLFARDARYWSSPFAEPLRGRDAIVRDWVAGTSVLLDHAFTVLAVEGELVIAQWTVRLEQSTEAIVDIDGILLLTFDGAGDCATHREWFMSRQAAS